MNPITPLLATFVAAMAFFGIGWLLQRSARKARSLKRQNEMLVEVHLASTFGRRKSPTSAQTNPPQNELSDQLGAYENQGRVGPVH
jgi:hypothetical protein